ncbi:kinase domain-containing protein [Salix suchowensis]|nr:kinase domain-containing protein [Salix suchowensis]
MSPSAISASPPRAAAAKYATPMGTRWAKEKAQAGGSHAFDLPTDPSRIGPWILGECIGKGASGRVKLAKHYVTGELAAVKILPVAPLLNSRTSLTTAQAKHDKQRLGIDREITMMKLMNHPNIMRIYDVYEGEKELYLVLEYVEGGPGLLQTNYLWAQLCAYIFYHPRDLKPENILIHTLNRLSSRLLIGEWPPLLLLRFNWNVLWKPHYASPEIVNGEKYEGTATDIWSCGVILFALLTGRLPFDDKNVRHLLNKVRMGKYEMPAWIDPLARDLISRMLVVDVNTRITVSNPPYSFACYV